MFKILVILSLFIAIQCQIPGGFTDRPDLIKSATTQSMIKLAINELASSQNLKVSPINVVSVASQVVNGINYRIIFTARPASSDDVLLCTTKIYQQFTGARSVSSVECS